MAKVKFKVFNDGVQIDKKTYNTEEEARKAAREYHKQRRVGHTTVRQVNEEVEMSESRLNDAIAGFLGGKDLIVESSKKWKVKLGSPWNKELTVSARTEKEAKMKAVKAQGVSSTVSREKAGEAKAVLKEEDLHEASNNADNISKLLKSKDLTLGRTADGKITLYSKSFAKDMTYEVDPRSFKGQYMSK